jgi:hypothetical protein
MASTLGRSVCVSTSLMITGGKFTGVGSATPGEPPTLRLARQFAALSHALGAAFSLTVMSAKPWPSVAGYQRSL